MTGRDWTILIALAVIAFGGAAMFLVYTYGGSSAPAQQQQNPATQPFTQTGPSHPAVTGSSGASQTGSTVPSVPTADMERSPSAFVVGFYKWYLDGLATDQAFSVSNTFVNGRTKWLSPKLAASWGSIAENTGSDPVLLAQDFLPSWFQGITASTTKQSTGSGTVVVSWSGSAPEIQVVLVSSNDGWLIDSVSEPLKKK